MLPVPSSHSEGCASGTSSLGTVGDDSRKTSCKHRKETIQTILLHLNLHRAKNNDI